MSDAKQIPQKGHRPPGTRRTVWLVVMFSHSVEIPDPLSDEVMRGDNRALGPRIRVPASATPTERFIAWTGRRLPQ